MNKIISPWTAQLQSERPIRQLVNNISSDIAIIGGGIAGITTAYYILRDTPYSVTLLEGNKIAHGATGHNAGQIVSYFEKQLSSLVKEYGLSMAASAQQAIESGWGLLEEIYKEAHLQTPYTQFIGYAGLQDLETILLHLENSIFASNVKINVEPMLIAMEIGPALEIPEKYKGLYTFAPHHDIMSLLETDNPSYIAAISSRKGVMNSALFCEELSSYLVHTYKERFAIYEMSPVSVVQLNELDTTLYIKDCKVEALKVILCTNGFESFSIINRAGADIDTKFHHVVQGTIGYMAGYVEDDTRPPVAISYLPKRRAVGNTDNNTAPYFYFTRRNYVGFDNHLQTLVCIGGPESDISDSQGYNKEHEYPKEAQRVIDEFLHTTYKYAPEGSIDYQYIWHGLMGYTPNGVRMVGPEPLNPVLLYNLGCNGVGILPSIYGSKKISRFLNNQVHEPSVFDPLKKYD